MEGRACVFVDGENLRHSLIDLFSEESLFQSAEYLPASARWSDFFDWIVSAATTDRCRRLRTYWFAIEAIDCFPHGLEKLRNPERSAWLKRALSRYKHYQEQLRGRKEDTLANEIQRIVAQLKESQQQVESRFRHWTAIRQWHCARATGCRVPQSRRYLLQSLQRTIRTGEGRRRPTRMRHDHAAQDLRYCDHCLW
jgi:hypothetical protein